jgi:membrane-associated phospholipid phosphatase
MARYYGLRLLSWAVALFLVGTVVATVYLGWHFFVDDVAGIALAWGSVQLGKLMVTGSVRSPRRATANP